MPGIFIIDDNRMARSWLSGVVARLPNLHVCGLASSAGEALRTLERASPDVDFVDLALPDTSGLELVKQIGRTCPKSRIIVWSVLGSKRVAQAARAAGAHGYVEKNRLADIVAAVPTVMAGDVYFGEAPSACS